MSQVKNYLFLINLLIFKSILSYSQEYIPKYYGLQIKFNNAISEYDNSRYKIAKKLFKEIIQVDTFNFYWESNIYLSSIYKHFGKSDSAKIVIDRSLDNKEYINLNAIKMLKTTQKALEMNRIIDLNSYESYEDIVNELFPISLHVWPDKNPEPIGGFNNFKSSINDCITDSIYKRIEEESIFMFLTINYKGDVGRVSIRNDIFPKTIMNSILIKAYKSKWKPALLKNKPIGWSFSMSIKLQNK